VWAETKILTIHTPSTAILREYYGLGKNLCTFIVLTTTGAVGTQGFKAPETPGYYELGITTYNADQTPLPIS
jgi:hypothetical protein